MKIRLTAQMKQNKTITLSTSRHENTPFCSINQPLGNPNRQHTCTYLHPIKGSDVSTLSVKLFSEHRIISIRPILPNSTSEQRLNASHSYDSPYHWHIQETSDNVQNVWCLNEVPQDSLRWFSQCRSRTQVLYVHCVWCDVSPAHMALFTFCVVRRASAQRHIFGGCASRQGAMTLKFEFSQDFCAMHLPPSFIILCLLVRKLSCWHTYKQTNKQTHPQTHKQTDSSKNIQRSSLRYNVG